MNIQVVESKRCSVGVCVLFSCDWKSEREIVQLAELERLRNRTHTQGVAKIKSDFHGIKDIALM